jgi:hypothetical protein
MVIIFSREGEGQGVVVFVHMDVKIKDGQEVFNCIFSAFEKTEMWVPMFVPVAIMAIFTDGFAEVDKVSCHFNPCSMSEIGFMAMLLFKGIEIEDLGWFGADGKGVDLLKRECAGITIDSVKWGIRENGKGKVNMYVERSKWIWWKPKVVGMPGTMLISEEVSSRCFFGLEEEGESSLSESWESGHGMKSGERNFLVEGENNERMASQEVEDSETSETVIREELLDGTSG